MSDLEKLIERVTKFRDARDWKQFHNPKDSAIALTSEAVEVLEHFLWKSPQENERKYPVEKAKGKNKKYTAYKE